MSLEGKRWSFYVFRDKQFFLDSGFLLKWISEETF